MGSGCGKKNLVLSKQARVRASLHDGTIHQLIVLGDIQFRFQEEREPRGGPKKEILRRTQPKKKKKKPRRENSIQADQPEVSARQESLV